MSRESELNELKRAVSRLEREVAELRAEKESLRAEPSDSSSNGRAEDELRSRSYTEKSGMSHVETGRLRRGHSGGSILSRRRLLTALGVAGGGFAATSLVRPDRAEAATVEPHDDTSHTDGPNAKTQQANSFSARQDFTADARVSGPSTYFFRAGPGTPYGPPPNPPTLELANSGQLSGSYRYAYLESDTNGETTLSPSASISPSGQKVRVTIPLPRRGVSARQLFRTTAGGNTFKLVHDFGGGDGWFQTVWLDDTPDGALGRNAPSADTSGLFNLDIGESVKYLRTGPDQEHGPADLTVLTGDPEIAGGYAIDSYDTITARTRNGTNFYSLHTGFSNHHLYCNVNDIVDDGSSPINVFNIAAQGRVNVRPTDKGISLYVRPQSPLTQHGTAGVYITMPSGTSQPAAWIIQTGKEPNGDVLLLQQTDPAATAALLKLQHTGSGFLIQDSSNRFRVQTDGTLNLRTSTWNFIPHLQVTGQLRAPYVSGTPNLSTNGELRIDNSGHLWFYSGGDRYRLTGERR